MKHIQITLIFLFISYISFAQKTFSESITKQEITDHLYYLASDELEGRDTGSPGQKKAAIYIAKEFKINNLMPINDTKDSGYFQKFTYKTYPETENVIGYIQAENKDAGWIIITAHYDHIGKKGDKIFNGADDNASGTTALIEIAEACSDAKKAGINFKKNIMFIAFSAEEKGLVGAEHFVSSSIADTINMDLNINMDMIGKSIKYGIIETLKERENSEFKEDTTLREDYVYLLTKGKNTGRYSKYSKKAGNQRKFQVDRSPGFILKLAYKGASDHKPFYDAGVPIMVYFTGLHPDYHTERDTPDKIDYDNLTIITKIIFETVYKISTEE